MDKFCPAFIWVLIDEKNLFKFSYIPKIHFYFWLQTHKIIIVRFYEIYSFIRLLLGNEKD